MPTRILVVEDETKLRRVIGLHLEASGFEVDQSPDAENALDRANSADLILTDLKLPGMDGLTFLKEVHSHNPMAAVVVMTAYGSVEAAVEAMKNGAADFLQKPFSLEHLTTVINKVLSVQMLRAENQRLKAELDQRYQFDS